MRFTLKQLEYFIATVDAGSIKLASDRINISAPSISAAIAHLEEQLEVQLFVRRHAQGLSLTMAGKTIAREARLLLSQAENLYTVSAEIRNEIKGKLSVGCMITLAPMIVPELIKQFTLRHNDAALSFVEGSHEQLIERLHAVDIDAAISYDLQFPQDIQFEPLATLPPQVLLPPSHKLARRKSIKLSALVDEPLILLDLPYSGEYFSSLFRQQGLKPTIFSRSANLEVVRSMVANGFGYTIANVRPKNQSTLSGKKLISVKLDGQHQPMTIGLATRRADYNPMIMQAFSQHCRETINERSIPGMQAP